LDIFNGQPAYKMRVTNIARQVRLGAKLQSALHDQAI